MRRRVWVLAALAVAIAALALALVLHSRHVARRHPQPLITAAPAALTAVRATWRSGRTVALVRHRGQWQMIKPVNAPADRLRVHALLAALAEPVIRSYSAAGLALAAFGLAPPRLVVTADGRRIRFGSVNPANGLRYVLRGDQVLLVADTIVPRLAAGPWQFLDTHLVPPTSRIAALHFGDGLAHAADAARLAGAWQTARADMVEPLAADAVPTGAPRIRVRLRGRAQPLVFVLLARTPRLRLGRPAAGIQYVMPRTAASRLLPAGSAPHARTAGG